MSIESALIKHNENLYKEYINEHRLNVQKAWNVMKNNSECRNLITKVISNTNLDTTIKLVDDLIIHHDESKYEPEEFYAYRANFFPISPEEKNLNKEEFDKAWKHHYTHNMHHWNWWYESGNLDNMPMIYVIEMICDWEAMGYKFGNTSKEWFEKNKSEIYLGYKQEEFAEELMNILSK